MDDVGIETFVAKGVLKCAGSRFDQVLPQLLIDFQGQFSALGEARATALLSPNRGPDERLASCGINLLDHVPGAAIRHASGFGGLRYAAIGVDRLKQLGTAGAQHGLALALDPDTN